MKKIALTLVASVALAGCVTTAPVVNPDEIADTTPNIWHSVYMGAVNGCTIYRTIMSDAYRIYSIHCGYKKDVGAIYQRGDNCHVERNIWQEIHFPEYKDYKILCTGPLVNYKKGAAN